MTATAPKAVGGVGQDPYAQAGQWLTPPVGFVVQSWNGPPEQLAELLAEMQRAEAGT